jgi:hypothetical protein
MSIPPNKITYTDKNALICTTARMNPPTPGHLSVIKELITTAQEHNVHFASVFLSRTQNNSDNPLKCDDKKKYLELMIAQLQEPNKGIKSKYAGVTVEVICSEHPSPFMGIINRANEMASNITPMDENAALNLYVIVGDDRIDTLSSVVTEAFKLSNNKVNSAGGVASARSQSNEVKTAMQVFKDQTSSAAKLQQYVDTTGPLKWVEGMSATVVRNIAKFGTQEQFNTLYADNLDAATSSELRLCIRRAYGKEDMDNTPVLEDTKTTKAPSQKRARSSEITDNPSQKKVKPYPFNVNVPLVYYNYNTTDVNTKKQRTTETQGAGTRRRKTRKSKKVRKTKKTKKGRKTRKGRK